MDNTIPKPTEYLAALYKPATHAPDCDYYLFADDLAKLGIYWSDTSKREIRVPFDVNERLVTKGEITFITDTFRQPTLALTRSFSFDGIRTELVIAPEDEHASNRILWCEQNCGPQSKMTRRGPNTYVRFSEEDYVLYRLRWLS